MTDVEKKRKQQQDLRLQQMLEAGVQVAGLTESGDTKKKPAFDKKKKGPKKEEVDLEAAAERARKQAEEAEAERVRLAKEAEEAAAAADDRMQGPQIQYRSRSPAYQRRDCDCEEEDD